MSRWAVEVREVSPGDVEALVAGMREADRIEVEACGHRPAEALADAIARSMPCWTATINGQVACIFGVAPLSLLGGLGAPWMLGTVLLDRHPRALMTHCRPYLNRMREVFPRLVNFVDARNERSIRWLKALGFRFHEAAPHGPFGLPFHRFEMG